MKAIILAAGYATRLYPLTLNRPKALLQVGSQTVLDYIIDEIETIDVVSEIIIVSNHKFYDNFMEWKALRNFKIPVKIIDDGTTSEEGKLGAIADIHFIIEKESIDEDILVIAGDNLFTFKLKDFYEHFLKTKWDCILAKQIPDTEILKRVGVVLIDSDSKVLDFEEKPQNPKSNLAVFASYIYLRETLPMFKQYLEEGNKADAPGFFPAWLYKRKNISTYIINGDCYDIGTHESYREVQEKFAEA